MFCVSVKCIFDVTSSSDTWILNFDVVAPSYHYYRDQYYIISQLLYTEKHLEILLLKLEHNADITLALLSSC